MTDGASPMRAPPFARGTEALEVIARRYAPSLKGFFTKRAPATDVDDLVQEVFARLAARSAAEVIDNPEAYLFQTAANLLRDNRRRYVSHRGDAHEPFEESEHGATEISPERELIAKQEVARLAAALDELPQRTRDIFLLHRYHGLKHAEIARRLGVSESAVGKNMMRAAAFVMKRMGRTRP